MGDMTVGDRLLESCEELYNKNVLTRNQYKQCIDAMDGGDKFKKIKIAEQNIFSSSREAKENKYENFLKSVKQVIDELFKKLVANRGGKIEFIKEERKAIYIR